MSSHVSSIGMHPSTYTSSMTTDRDRDRYSGVNSMGLITSSTSSHALMDGHSGLGGTVTTSYSGANVSPLPVRHQMSSMPPLCQVRL